MSDKLDHDAVNKLWQLTFHEDKIFNDRLSFFLLSESVLLTSVVMLFGANALNLFAFRTIAIFGCIMSLMWLIVQRKQKKILDGTKLLLEQNDSAYKRIMDKRHDLECPYSNSWIFTNVVPVFVCSMWVILLCLK